MNSASQDFESNFFKSVKLKDIILLMFFIYSVQFILIPLNTNRMAIVFMVAYLALFAKEKWSFPISRDFFKAHSLFFVYLLYTCVVSLVSGGSNLNSMLTAILFLAQLSLGSYLIVNFFIKRGIEYFYYCLVLIFAIQGFLIFLNFLIPSYREFMFVVMPQTGNITEDNFTSAFRTRGFMQNSGAITSAYLSTGLLFVAYFLGNVRLSKRDLRILYMCVPWIIISMLFTGRTGFLMVPVAFLLYYFLLLLNKKFSLVSLLPLVYLPILAVVLYFVCRSLFVFFSPENESVISMWEKWAFENFLVNFGIQDSNVKQLNTIDKLNSYFFFPDKDIDFIFGDPLTWGIIRTDLGYIRMLFSVGFLGSFLFYMSFILLYYSILKNLEDWGQKILVLFLFVWLALVEYKEPMFANVYFASTSFLIYYFSLNNKNYEVSKVCPIN